jgi:hypothetical protein
MDSGLKQLQQELTSAMTGFSSTELQWHPPGKWCTAEVLEHLFLTYTGTMKGLERMMEAGQPSTTPPTWRQRVRKLVVLSFSYLPPGRQAPSFSRPRGLPTEKVQKEIAAKIAEMDDRITRCEEKFGMRTKLLDHLIIGPLTGAQWRKFHVVHGQHHLKQIERLREEMLKPTATDGAAKEE